MAEPMGEAPQAPSVPADPPPPARRGRRWWIVAAVLLSLLTLDALRAPQDQWGAVLLLGGIDLYQATLSPLMPKAGVHCRFTPTCSHYGEGVIRKYGAYKGGVLAFWRILRCGPWTPRGTVDPP